MTIPGAGTSNSWKSKAGEFFKRKTRSRGSTLYSILYPQLCFAFCILHIVSLFRQRTLFLFFLIYTSHRIFMYLWPEQTDKKTWTRTSFYLLFSFL
ncbi:hypothetical protein B0F90DRAFT_1723095, partial [Multifurca ochricompacta]